MASGGILAVEPVESTEEGMARALSAEIAMRRAYQDNRLEELDLATELDAAVLGDGCFKVIWHPEERRVRVTAPDVQGIFAWWVGDDPSKVWRVASRYGISADDADHLYNVMTGDQDGMATVVEGWTKSQFQLWVGDAPVDQRPNPYGFIPFVIFPNLRDPKRFWGISDIPILMEPARELNRALSQLSTILELSGNPIAVLEGVEESRDIAVEPGAVWELPDQARAYLLDLLQGGGAKLHGDYIKLVYDDLHDPSEAPRISFGHNPQRLSGVALEMEMHPLLQRVERKRLIRSWVYRRRAEMALKMQERSLVEAGIHSRRRAMERLGVTDPDSEQKTIRRETMAETTSSA